MTERSYFWNHAVVGDAVYSPYNASEFNTWFSYPFAGDFALLTDVASNVGPFVIPDYLEDLQVISAGTSVHAVVVSPGAAVINNQLYENTESKTLSIDRPPTGYYRKDIIVLRLSEADSKIRLAVVKGTDTASFPTLPALTQTASTWEMPLAAVYVNRSYPYINNIYIYDKRKFQHTFFNASEQPVPPPNLLVNSEWLLISNDVTPAHWESLTGVMAHDASTSLLGGRGKAVDWGASGTDAMWQWIPTKPNTTYSFRLRVRTTQDIPATGAEAFSVRILGYKLGQVTESLITDEVMFSAGEALENIEAGEVVDINFTFTLPDEIDIIRVLLTRVGTTFTTIKLYQPILCEGYNTGYDRPVHEVLLVTSTINDGSWNLTSKSTGNTLIDLTASFSAEILPHVKAIIIKLRARDSGSAAAANCFLRATGYAAPYNAPYGTLQLEGVPNDVIRETMCIVPVDQIYTKTGVAGAQFRLVVQATGAGTLDANVAICGVIT